MEGQGSDLHVKVGSPPMIRLPGGLVRMPRDPLTPAETEAIAESIVPADRRETFHTTGEIDFAYSLRDVGRFRANVFKQRGSTSMVLRRLRFGGPDVRGDGAARHGPATRRRAPRAHPRHGPDGLGQDHDARRDDRHINETKPVHIVTIEDPIEVLHRDAMASINQREIGNDTQDFLSALRAALRQDPDVILIGEMRDTETVRAAIQAAETGHLVLSTLHTVDATETVNRVIDFFPPYQQKQVRLALAGTLRGIICQRLVATVDGGRTPRSRSS